jgi:hypothetical protein
VSDEAQAAFGAPAPASAPSRAGYVLGSVLIVLAIAGAILWVVPGFVRLGDAVDDLVRVPLERGGSEIVVELDAGKQSIYYEAPDAQERTPSVTVAILGAETGEHSGSVSYSIGGHTGVSVASADIPRDGRYRVASGSDDPSPGAQLAIGPGLGSRIVRIIVGGFAVFLLGAIAGTVVIVVTSSRRRRARQGAAGVALPMR